MKDDISPLYQGLWILNLAGYWLFCGFYDRGLGRRKLAAQASAYFYPSLSKEYKIFNVKEAIGMQRKACACRK